MSATTDAEDVTNDRPSDAADDGRDDRSAERRRSDLAARYQFDRCCQAAFDVVVDGWERRSADGHRRGSTDDTAATDDRPSLDEIATALDHGPVAPAFTDWVLQDSDAGSAELDAFAAELIDSSPPPRTGALFVRAMNAEADGRVLDAEAAFEATLASLPDYVPAIYELARFASDRGDIARAVVLYRQVGSGAQPEVDFLTGLMPDWSKVGRNDPCPCGSGRKFKQCHLDDPEVPADRAALWLFQKVLGFAYRSQFEPARRRLARIGVATSLPGEEIEPIEGDALHRNALYQGLMDAPFFLDLAVFEGGIIERFAAERAVLLPPAEVEMLQDWIAVERRLWEIVEVHPRQHIGLRDVVSGATVEVAERVASESATTSELLLGLVVPVRGEMQLIGQPLSVAAQQRQPTIDLVESGATAEAWAAWFARVHTDPTSTNLQGEPLIAGAAVIRPSSAIDVVALLDEHYQPGEAPRRWVERLDLDGQRLVLAHLDLEDDGRLVVTANSDVRMDRVLDRLRSADPGLVIEGDERRPFDEEQLAALVSRSPG